MHGVPAEAIEMHLGTRFLQYGAVAAVLLGGCESVVRDDAPADAPPTLTSAGTSGGIDLDPDQDAESSGSSGGGGLLLDVGHADPDGPGMAAGCNAVDILFVIDNSASMTSYQDQLTAAFPSFVDAMDATLPEGTSVHVGVTTSSFCGGNNPPHTEINCVAAESAILMSDAYVSPSEGTVPGDGYQGRLRSFDGRNYFDATTGDADSMQALGSWFAGAAGVGSQGCNHEFNAAGAAHVFAPENATANAGFVRDEGAVLLLFILSDEGDQSFAVEDAAALEAQVRAAKAGCGADACIVGAGLFSEFCTPDTNAAHAFLSSLSGEPVWGPIGSLAGPPPDYEETVGAALAQIVAQSCEEVPPAA